MARSLPEILAHLRAAIADGSIKTTLIQTEDLALLCDAADPALRPKPIFIEEALQPKPNWKRQSFEYYAAHFLVGAGLLYGDVRSNFVALTRARCADRHGCTLNRR